MSFEMDSSKRVKIQSPKEIYDTFSSRKSALSCKTRRKLELRTSHTSLVKMIELLHPTRYGVIYLEHNFLRNSNNIVHAPI